MHENTYQAWFDEIKGEHFVELRIFFFYQYFTHFDGLRQFNFQDFQITIDQTCLEIK